MRPDNGEQPADVGWGGPELRVDAIEVEIAEYRHQEDHSDHDQQYDPGPPPMSARTGDIGGKHDSGACIGGLERHRPVRFHQPAPEAQNSVPTAYKTPHT